MSRYPENVLVNNHTCVWGSWWNDGMWGYACCHQVVKNSYCTGKAGEAAAAATQQQMVENLQARQREADARLAAEEEEEEEEGRRTLQGGPPNKDVWGEAATEQELDESKLKEAIKVCVQRKRVKCSTPRLCRSSGCWQWGRMGMSASASTIAWVARRR